MLLEGAGPGSTGATQSQMSVPDGLSVSNTGMDAGSDAESTKEGGDGESSSGGDGFFKDIKAPEDKDVGPTPSVAASVSAPSRVLTSQEMDAEKANLLRKLRTVDRTVFAVREMTADNTYNEIRNEWMIYQKERATRSSIETCHNITVIAARGVEILGQNYSPIRLELDGWSNSIAASMKSDPQYDDVFAELCEKYGGVSTDFAPPEVRLAFLLVTSAASYHFMASLSKSFGGGGPPQMPQQPPMPQHSPQPSPNYNPPPPPTSAPHSSIGDMFGLSSLGASSAPRVEAPTQTNIGKLLSRVDATASRSDGISIVSEGTKFTNGAGQTVFAL